MLAQLRHDRDVLRTGGGSAHGTHYLEIRPAGQGGGEEAYYLRLPQLAQYIDEVALARELPKIKKLVGLEITEAMLRDAGYGAANKGRFGRYVRKRLEPMRTAIRTGPVGQDLKPLEDLLICERSESPADMLRRSVYMPMQETKWGRRIVDARSLAPSSVLAQALRVECSLLKRGGTAIYLNLKSHHFAGKRGEAFYLRARRLSEYLLIVEQG